MTTKQKFEIEEPPVIMLANGRYAYRCKCPWEGKNGKELYAFKFCSSQAYREQCKREEDREEQDKAESERPETPPTDDEERDQEEAPEEP